MRYRLFLFVAIWSFTNSYLWAQTDTMGHVHDDTSLDEGPHIWITDSGFTVKSIEQGVLHTSYLSELPSGIPANLSPDECYDFQDVSKFLAISDIHGQCGLFKQFLQAHGVIDHADNWSYGTGHLVVLGDIMDRGDGVTEALWLVYKLTQQAVKDGGRVHYLAGNHELMVMDGDLRYINKKYEEAASLIGTTYDNLFSPNTVLGNWLAQRPVIISINDILFVHAGISPAFIEQGFEIQQVNQYFKENIYPQSKVDYRKDSTLRFLATQEGPLWYRGYFRDEMLPESSFEQQLDYFGKQYMVVGHTSFNEIQMRYSGRLFAIDSSIKSGRRGEVLVFSDGQFFRGQPDGVISTMSSYR